MKSILSLRNSQLVVVNILAVDAVAVTAGAGVDANVFPLRSGEAIKNLVVDINESLEHLLASPWIPRVILASKPAWNDVS
jgi:hypothetical protein